MKAFVRELRKRHVFKVSVAYLVASWLVLQLADVIFPAMSLPEWAITLVLGLLAVGFPLALVLAWVFDVTPEGVQRTPSAASEAETDVTSAGSGPAPAVTHSIAVLPFPDFSAERDQEHFCDGLTEELLNVLTNIPGLRVASRTSSFAFKGKNTDLAAVAQKLQVAHVLEGSVRKAGNKVRITAQLIEVATDSHLWSETYDRELDDIFAIQDDIAKRILTALKLTLVASAGPDPTTANARAYEYFLRGRGYAITRISQDHDRAIALFKKAVKVDPDFVRAWIDLAEICSSQALYHGGGERARQLADHAGRMAKQLAPERPGSYMARGFSHLAGLRYADAERDFLKAMEKNPLQATAYHFLGRTSHLQGHLTKARKFFTRATELDPEDWESPLLALQGYEKDGDREGALRVAALGIERAERYLEDYPDNPRAYYLGTTALSALGQKERAI
jgi:adenylate cyclase